MNAQPLPEAFESQASKARAIMWLVLGVLMLASAALLLRVRSGESMAMVVLAVGFGALCIYAGVQNLRTPAVLKMDRTGFAYGPPSKPRRTAWVDCSEFHVSVRTTYGIPVARFVAWTVETGGQKGNFLQRAMTQTMGQNYNVPAKDLAILMSRFRARARADAGL